jgi:hypothetical protein
MGNEKKSAPMVEFHAPGGAMAGVANKPIGLCVLDVPFIPEVRREIAKEEQTARKPPESLSSDDVLKGVRIYPLKNARVMMLPNPVVVPKDRSDPLCEYGTDEKGDLYSASDSGTLLKDKKQASFPAGACFHYFWTHNDALYQKIKGLYRKAFHRATGKYDDGPPDSDALQAFVDNNGFDALEVRPDHLDYYTSGGHQLFDSELLAMDKGGSTMPRKQLAALMHSVRGGEKQGLIWHHDLKGALGTDLERAGFDGANATQYVFARRPALSAVFFAEVVACMMVNDIKKSTWHYTQFATAEAIMRVAKNPGLDAAALDEGLHSAGVEKKANPTQTYALERFRKYAHDCAAARKRKDPEGAWMDRQLFAKAVNRFDTKGQMDAAIQIRDEFAVWEPGAEEGKWTSRRPLQPLASSPILSLLGKLVDSDRIQQYFDLYQFGLQLEEFPYEHAKDEKQWHDLAKDKKDKSKPWYDVVKDVHSSIESHSKAAIERMAGMLAELAPFPVLMRDLASHSCGLGDRLSAADEQQRRNDLHERFFKCAVDFRYSWWDQLVHDRECAKNYYGRELKPFLDVVFSGADAEKGAIYESLFEGYMHELMMWLREKHKGGELDEIFRIGELLSPLVASLGAPKDQPLASIEVTFNLEKELIELGCGDEEDSLTARFYHAKTVKEGKGLVKKAIKAGATASEKGKDAAEKVEKARLSARRAAVIAARKRVPGARKVAKWLKETKGVSKELIPDGGRVFLFVKRGAKHLPACLETLGAIVELAENLADAGELLEKKGFIKTFLPLTSKVVGSLKTFAEATEHVIKHVKTVRRLLMATGKAKEILHILHKAAGPLGVAANVFEGVVLVLEGMEMLELSESAHDRGQETQATLYKVKGIVMIGGGGATVAVTVVGLLAGVGCASIVAITGPILMVVGAVCFVIDVAIEYNKGALDEFRDAFYDALAGEFGSRFDQKNTHDYGISHTHHRILHVESEVNRALRILRLRHPMDGTDLARFYAERKARTDKFRDAAQASP